MKGGGKIEGNKESTAVIVGANTTVLSPDIPIRISYIIIAEIWRFYNAPCAYLVICRRGARTILFPFPDIPIRISNVKEYLGDKNRREVYLCLTSAKGGIFMRKVSEKIQLQDGTCLRCQKDIRRLLNLKYLSLTNKTYTTGEYDFPVLYCKTVIVPDYLALYNQPGSYHRTALTGVCFYTYDPVFDGVHGLFNAIYYDDKNLLEFYRERFKDVKFIISPDYSQFGDLQKIENLYRLWKARIVTLWFILELRAVAIPSITYISEESFPLFFSGIEGCEVVAFSTKGHIRYAAERTLLKAAVKYAVDHLPLKTIIVYSVCGNDETALRLFQYAINNGIRVVIPNNSLRERNRGRCLKS